MQPQLFPTHETLNAIQVRKRRV